MLKRQPQKREKPPKQPLKLADWLIDRGLKDGIRLYSKNDLRELASYLLIYCGNEKNDDRYSAKKSKMNAPNAEISSNANCSVRDME